MVIMRICVRRNLVYGWKDSASRSSNFELGLQGHCLRMHKTVYLLSRSGNQDRENNIFQCHIIRSRLTTRVKIKRKRKLFYQDILFLSNITNKMKENSKM